MSDHRLPAERFYWGVLDTSDLPPTPPWSRQRTTRLGYLFESVLPVPIESVHTSFLPVGPDRVLACAMEQDSLSELHAHGWTTLGPSALPDLAVFSDLRIQAASINLLQGTFESPAVRRARGRWSLALAAVLGLVMCLVVVGIERRVQRAESLAAAAESAIDAVYAQVLPPSGPNAQPAEARFLSELRALQQTRIERTGPSELSDAGRALADVLGRWPDDLESQTNALSVSATSIALSTTVDATSDAQSLISELGVLDGWQVTQDAVTPTRDGVQVRRAWSPERSAP